MNEAHRRSVLERMTPKWFCYTTMERLQDAWGPFVGNYLAWWSTRGSCRDKERKLNCLQYRFRLFTVTTIACFFCHFTHAAKQ